ncbi:Mediator of RNA polymerase II transcription subunit 7 [Mortierella sp. GBA30]|nr:Mediator of RNA polymerase II transcription subunit 7 [Mortierella sp. GBA30]
MKGVQDSLATLEDQGIEQLYPKGPIDRVQELKKLNHSAVFNFLELVHTLATSPSEARETLRLMMEDQLNRKRQETAAMRKTCANLRKQLAALRALKQERLPAPVTETDVDMAAVEQSGAIVASPVQEAPTAKSLVDTNARQTSSSSGETDNRLLSDSASSNPVALKDAEAMARMMDLCDTIQ